MTTSLELRPTPPQIIGPAAPAHSFGDLERMAQVIATGGLVLKSGSRLPQTAWTFRDGMTTALALRAEP